MSALKPILIFSIAFSLGASLVLYAVFTSQHPDARYGLLLIPAVGGIFGFATLLVRQLNTLWHGVLFVLFVISLFVYYKT